MDVKFLKDYQHNYMIVKCEQEEFAHSYSCKFLSANKIKGILHCSVRYINSMAYLYYDVTSCTTLAQLFQSKKMTFEQIKELFWQTHQMLTDVSAYFMEEIKLVLLPEFLFYSLSEKSYRGVFCPEYEAGEHPYAALMDFVLSHMDTGNQKLADCIYQIYEMSEEEGFRLEDAVRMIDEYNDTENAEDVVLTAQVKPEIHSVDEDCGMFSFEDVQSEQKEERKGKTGIFYPVFAVISILGMMGCVTVWYFYELTKTAWAVLLACLLIMGGCFVFCLLHIGKKKEPSRAIKEKTSEENIFYEEAEVSLNDVINTGLNSETPQKDHFIYSRATERTTDGLPDFESGNTVFFEKNDAEGHKLYALDRKNKTHIELYKFPYTVGKMAGYVDLVLPDDSVSRIHARFDKQGDTVLLTDLNSTNGTFKNGLRMQPQETVEIEPGDEIRFGKLNYCYR